MKDCLKNWHLYGALFAMVLGTLLHFVFAWSNGNKVVAVFGAVNESTWEHCKLLFWPLLIYGIVEYFFIGKNYQNFLLAKTVSLYLGVFLIISIFYTYSGIIGRHFFVMDILLFIASIVIAQVVSYKIMISDKTYDNYVNLISMALVIILALLFIIFTFYPPHIQLFKDSQSNRYGII